MGILSSATIQKQDNGEIRYLNDVLFAVEKNVTKASKGTQRAYGYISEPTISL